MRRLINATHDPDLRSWVESAHREDCDFPIQNLPIGAFREREGDGDSRLGVAIGDQILDLRRCADAGLLNRLPRSVQNACRASLLNPLMVLGNGPLSRLRRRLSELLRVDGAGSRVEGLLVPMDGAELLMPVEIGDYTDFYASVFHATNVGRMFRPHKPILPNYKHIPIGYHGRSSSIVVSGTPVRRPTGQRKLPDADIPVFGSSKLLDYELEVGLLVSVGSELGQPVKINRSEEHIFGLCLVNDWSARDLQAWEYQPLGPFLAKSFATTISPWVVTLEALAPYRCPAFERPEDDPVPLPYLHSRRDARQGGIEITLEVFLTSEKMRKDDMDPLLLSRGSFAEIYWTVGQMVTHQTSNGCNLRPGDLMASGTVSGPDDNSRGCLLEVTRRGARPLSLPTGEERRFLLDGDEIILRGYCVREGQVRVGFGECRGVILPPLKGKDVRSGATRRGSKGRKKAAGKEKIRGARKEGSGG